MTMHSSRTGRFLAAAFACFAFGGCTWMQSEEIARQAAALPRMTCEELLKNGAVGHRFVRLTDVHLGSGGHAFLRDMDAAMEMYIPIHSSREKEPAPADLRLLLEVEDDENRIALLKNPDA